MQTENAGPVTYAESLSVAWLLIWRGLLINVLIGFVIGFCLGFVLGFAGLSQWIPALSLFGGFVGSVFIGAPIVIRMMFRKQFSGFRVQLVRYGQQPATVGSLSVGSTV